MTIILLVRPVTITALVSS